MFLENRRVRFKHEAFVLSFLMD